MIPGLLKWELENLLNSFIIDGEVKLYKNEFSSQQMLNVGQHIINMNMQQQNFNQNPNNSNNGVHRNRTQSMPVSPDHNKTVPGQIPNQQGEESAEKIRQIRQSFANFFN